MAIVQKMNYSNDLRSQVSIDPDKLDVEWMVHAERVFDACEQVTEYEETFLSAKANEEEVYATLVNRVRKKPEKYGIDKITESAIKSVVEVHEKYMAAKEQTIAARHEWTTRKNLVIALDAKKKALENLVILWTSNYHSDPKDRTKGQSDSVLEQKKKERFQKQSTKFLRKKRL